MQSEKSETPRGTPIEIPTWEARRGLYQVLEFGIATIGPLGCTVVEGQRFFKRTNHPLIDKHHLRFVTRPATMINSNLSPPRPRRVSAETALDQATASPTDTERDN
ncbi:hypothetical protein RB10980 [Rhodopirellula baltica SH 1]|uniref:Uncharacterized protein n=1 Tax=Rhodopirellula baltica (strain DSM 10527 / NCIMB 13988 / SH1) TaxID=243090 RepID=Q7UJY3_RHOBA|nr:hypothetical protein RB10980 [Rhodopirellula baltica SH 1]